MRILMLFSLFLFSSQSFADVRVSITPTRPHDCELDGDYPSINSIYEVSIVNESDKELEVEFTTSYGACQDGRVVTAPMIERLAYLDLISDGITLPFQKTGIRSSMSFLSAEEALVNLRFQKNILFKKRDRRMIDLTFRPGGFIPVIDKGELNYVSGAFIWKVELQLDRATNKVKLSFLN